MSTSPSRKRPASEDGTVSPPPIKRKQQSTTTQKAVANFFKPASQKEPEKVTWRVVHNTLLIGKYTPSEEKTAAEAMSEKTKVAAFDFDSTLIKSKSGLTFARNAEDWQWWDPRVPGTLRRLHEDGYSIAIVSNQAALSLKRDSKTAKGDMRSLSNFKTKVGTVLSQLDLPIGIYAATEKDQYRKPRMGMWKELLRDHGLHTSDAVDLKNSVFVGDAAGRPARTIGGGIAVKKDHSCGDRNFAANVGITFKTPEEFFRDEATEPFIRVFDPAVYLKTHAAQVTEASAIMFPRVHDVELVIFSGSPASGKSTFYWKQLQPLGYERVNQDILKTRDKCFKVAGEHLQEGKSVAVDNTNADVQTRAYWINLAKKNNVPTRCIHFTTDPRVCEHNDKVRALNVGIMNPERRDMLPGGLFDAFMKKREVPTLSEGFQDITKVDFIVNVSSFQGNDEQKAIWSKYWV